MKGKIMSNEKLKTAVYYRIPAKEEMSYPGIKLQERIINSFLRAHSKYLVVDNYIDIDIPGTIPIGKRPDGERLLKDAREGKFDVVLVSDIERLGRDFKVILNAVDSLSDCGVKFRSILENYNTETNIDRLVFNMIMMFAEYEQELKKNKEKSVTTSHRN